jgi:uncharacterized protein YdeI (BOF family)
MKRILVCLAILAVSTSGALAAKKKMAKPKAAAAAATTSQGPFMGANTSAADMKMYKKNQHDSGMDKMKK